MFIDIAVNSNEHSLDALTNIKNRSNMHKPFHMFSSFHGNSQEFEFSLNGKCATERFVLAPSSLMFIYNDYLLRHHTVFADFLGMS